ncbi:hypothetical protein VNI00_012672 [Paramarasmius palmivorus]|uniref:NACHT domain-containing protein n=1 Tax=Paramarasmius palmivorus TaxID=297713 RepID=A0AAW0C5K7_9AGAR
MLDDLSDWVEDKSRHTPVFWLYGTAGIGKSAIAQHIAEKYADNRLGAAFFFSRNDSTRDNLDPFVASIAYQLCKAKSLLNTGLRRAIMDAIRADPNVFETSCENQLQQLILEPCLRVQPALQGDLPFLLIVDGLDECVDHAAQERVLGIIRTLLASPTASMWSILICSRPEPQISDAFDHWSFGGISVSFDMNTLDTLNRDIEKYFTDQFLFLRTKYRSALRHESPLWPGDHVINDLVRRADRQIIFAVTVIKYIDNRDELPQDRLDRVLRIRTEGDSDSPYSTLDTLYFHILSTCRRWEKVRPILRLLVTPHTIVYDGYFLQRQNKFDLAWRSCTMIALLLNLKQGEVGTLLVRLHSVLQISDDINEQDVYIAHASFKEFLIDPSRSGQFYAPEISRSEYCDYLATFSLRTLSGAAQYYPPYRSRHQPFAEAWLAWCRKVKSPDERLRFSLKGWKLSMDVDHPSPPLLAELSKSDPFPIVTLMLFHRGDHKGALDLKDIIRWGRSRPGDPRIYRFIERWNPLSEQFCVAFRPGTSANEVFWLSFDIEYASWSCCWLGLLQCGILRRYTSLVMVSAWADNILLLPAGSSSSSMTVPEDWTVVPLERSNAEVFSRLCEPPIREGDLIHFSALVNERLEIIRELPIDRTARATFSFTDNPEPQQSDSHSSLSTHSSESVEVEGLEHVASSPVVTQAVLESRQRASDDALYPSSFSFGQPQPSPIPLLAPNLESPTFVHSLPYQQGPFPSASFQPLQGTPYVQYITDLYPHEWDVQLVSQDGYQRSNSPSPGYGWSHRHNDNGGNVNSRTSPYGTSPPFTWAPDNHASPVVALNEPQPQVHIPATEQVHSQEIPPASNVVVIDDKGKGRKVTIGSIVVEDYKGEVDITIKITDRNTAAGPSTKNKDRGQFKSKPKGSKSGGVSNPGRVEVGVNVNAAQNEQRGASREHNGTVLPSAMARNELTRPLDLTARHFEPQQKNLPSKPSQEKHATSHSSPSQQSDRHPQRKISRLPIRRGYWNRKGDHLTDTGYIVYAPPGQQYPPELAEYPMEDYKDPIGQIAPWVKRPELPDSLPRKGRPAVRPYESAPMREGRVS